MSTATMWFLVFMAGEQYIGPLPENGCRAAAAQLASHGVECRQTDTMMACDMPNKPGIYMACPVFNFPQVKLKKSSP